MKKKIAPADYVFTLEQMNAQNGLYEIYGVTADENTVENFLIVGENVNKIIRVQVFTLGLLEGPIQTITSIDEFMGYQNETR